MKATDENEVEIVDEMIAKEENEDEAKNVLEVLGMDEIKHEVEIIAKVESDEVFEIELDDDDVVEEEMKGRDKIVYELEYLPADPGMEVIDDAVDVAESEIVLDGDEDVEGRDGRVEDDTIVVTDDGWR